jgi:glycosyltransferase involved in cell wall biosynthesis
MRILAVIDSFGLGGAETQLAEATTVLAEKLGHNCLACSLLPRQSHEVRLSNRVERAYLGKQSFLSLPWVAKRLARVIRRYRPDVVYSRLPLANGIARIVTSFPGCRVLHVAGIDTVPAVFTAVFTMRHPGSLVFRWLERFADRIVCNSASTARAVVAVGYPRQRIRVIPNGIDLDKFSPPAHRVVHEPAQLVCVASFRPEKGVERLVRLLAPLLGTGRAVLTLIGDGPERTKVETAIADLGLKETVHLLGPQEDVVPVLRRSDLYVSAAHVEGFGIAVAEAAGTGLPAVCAAAPGGLDEVVLNGVTGYLIPQGRDELFRETVARLCSDAVLREQLGAAARHHIRNNFDIHDIAVRLEHCFVNP